MQAHFQMEKKQLNETGRAVTRERDADTITKSYCSELLFAARGKLKIDDMELKICKSKVVEQYNTQGSKKCEKSMGDG